MKVKIDKTIPLSCTATIAWDFLQNLESVAGCMPGAKLTERLDEHRHKGTVTVKVGPVKMSFRGQVEVQDIDPANMSLRLIGKGTDSTGNSGVSMNLLARINALEGDTCELVGSSEVSMNGKAAAFGGRMMNSVSDKILLQFATNFAAEVTTEESQAGDTDESVAAPASQTSDLNIMAIGWAVFTDWLRSLFNKKKA